MTLSNNLLPEIPELGLVMPTTQLLEAGVEFIKNHNDEPTVIHCYRTAYWAMLIAKNPRYADVDINMDVVLYAIMMHEVGFNSTLASKDKRFEVDGANIARDFIADHAGRAWTQKESQLVWDSIALHTSPSIAWHKEPEVAITQLALMVDLFGPDVPGNLVTKEQFIAVTKVLPRKGLKDSMPLALCCLCRDKPETTYDGLCADFGMTLGYDGKGQGREEYSKKVEENRFAPSLIKALNGLEQWEESGFA